MKVKGIDHIAIAVKDIDAGIKKFKKVLGAKFVTKIEGKLAGEKITVAYLKVGEDIIALDSSDDPNSSINKFIEKRGEGLNHIGVEVDNLEEFSKKADQEGLKTVYKITSGSIRKEMVIHPKDFCGVLLQVIEWDKTTGTTFDERIQKTIENMKK